MGDWAEADKAAAKTSAVAIELCVIVPGMLRLHAGGNGLVIGGRSLSRLFDCKIFMAVTF